MSQKYKGLFEKWEEDIAGWIVGDFQRAWHLLRKDGKDDLVQECLIYWLEKKVSYDSSLGVSQKDYMRGVLKNHLWNIKDRIYAKKRKAIYDTESVDECFLDEDSATPTKKKREPAVEPGVSLKIDMALAIASLTPKQIQICKMLREEDISSLEISRRLKTHHSTIQREKRRIQKLFEQRGLRVYLK